MPSGGGPPARRLPPRRFQVAFRCAGGVAAGRASSPGVACAAEPAPNRTGFVWSSPVPPWRCVFALALAVFRPGAFAWFLGEAAPVRFGSPSESPRSAPPRLAPAGAKRAPSSRFLPPSRRGGIGSLPTGVHRPAVRRPRRSCALGGFVLVLPCARPHRTRCRVRGSLLRGSLLLGQPHGLSPAVALLPLRRPPAAMWPLQLATPVFRALLRPAMRSRCCPRGPLPSRASPPSGSHRATQRRFRASSALGLSRPSACRSSRGLTGFESRSTRARFAACPLAAPAAALRGPPCRRSCRRAEARRSKARTAWRDWRPTRGRYLSDLEERPCGSSS